MKKNIMKTAENELHWIQNNTLGLAWISKGFSWIFLMLAFMTSSIPWFLLLFITRFVVEPVACKRYIYPRTGQVKLKKDLRTFDVLVFSFVVLAIPIYFYLLGMWKNYIPHDTTLLGLCVGFLMGGLMWLDYMAWDGKSAYPIWERVFIIIVLLSLFWLEPKTQNILLLMVPLGLFNFGYGLVTFIHFIRNNPILPNEYRELKSAVRDRSDYP
ncbi:MAG: hypothetical protein V3576_02155 [Candidatus Cloacimonadota bacterium]